VRLYDPLFTRPDPGTAADLFAELNADSLEILPDCRLEPALDGAALEQPLQFERLGYFTRDPDSAEGHPVFNRTIGLRDSRPKPAPEPAAKK
jgi:glutaminyl-tRNA synthetase